MSDKLLKAMELREKAASSYHALTSGLHSGVTTARQEELLKTWKRHTKLGGKRSNGWLLLGKQMHAGGGVQVVKMNRVDQVDQHR